TVRLPGGGGAATMMPTARRAVVWQTTHTPQGLVEKVDFATAAGATTLVTPLAVFARAHDGAFALSSYRTDLSVEDVRARTGFAFDAGEAVPTPAPTPAELKELERLDRDRVLDRSFGRARTGRESGTRSRR